MSNLKEELSELRFEHGIIQRVQCSKEETKNLENLKKVGKPFPQDVFYNRGGSGAIDPEYYFREAKTDLSEQEVNELLMYRQTSYLKSIKNGITFFVILTVISLAATLISLFAL